MWPPLGQRHVGTRRPDADQSFESTRGTSRRVPRRGAASRPLRTHLRTVSGSRTAIGFLYYVDHARAARGHVVTARDMGRHGSPARHLDVTRPPRRCCSAGPQQAGGGRSPVTPRRRARRRACQEACQPHWLSCASRRRPRRAPRGARRVLRCLTDPVPGPVGGVRGGGWGAGAGGGDRSSGVWGSGLVLPHGTTRVRGGGKFGGVSRCPRRWDRRWLSTSVSPAGVDVGHRASAWNDQVRPNIGGSGRLPRREEGTRPGR